MDKTTAGFIVLLTALGSAGITAYLDNGTQLYACESKGLVSDCVNGVKADGTRCYYDPDNGRRYTHCPEGWSELKGYTSEKRPAVRIEVRENDKVWTCEIVDGRADSYTKCVSGSYEAYLGELV